MSIFEELYDRSRAAGWGVPPEAFRAALEASVSRGLPGGERPVREIEAYLRGLHVEDLALAAACAAGHEAAWEHFVREYRPLLHRAAGAIGHAGARELADSVYADLYGLQQRDGERRSLFRYYHGRSSLATWLRAVLAQRQVDGFRQQRRLEPLPDADAMPAAQALDPDRPRYVAAIRQALATAVARLPARDRLRLRCYYVQDLTLAAIGRLLGEHEATVSRHLARTRRAIRDDVDRILHEECGFDEPTREACLRSVAGDAGAIDLGELVGSVPDAPLEAAAARTGKIVRLDRSQ